MKRVLIALMTMFLSISICTAASYITDTGEPYYGSEQLHLSYYYDSRYNPHFIFSDVADIKSDDFEDLMNKPGLERITLSTVKDGRLYNDGNLYVHWLVEPYIPIDKMTIEMPTPLKLAGQDELDWYVLVDGSKLLGGKNGYGPSNEVTLYERDKDTMSRNLVKSVQLRMWTDDITGKKAGNYLGSLVLKVVGEC